MEPDPTGHLSRRGMQLAARSPAAEYIVEHYARAGSRWHPTSNPDGYVPLCIAENNLMADLILPQLSRESPPPGVLGYATMTGTETFRMQIATLLERAFLGKRFAPHQIAVLAGAGAVLETVFYALADPGDAVLVPTPSYAGFWADLGTRDGLHIVPVARSDDDGFRLTPRQLDEAADGADRPIRALLFTNPDNPLGRIARADEIEAVLAWAETRGIHVVFDEIYALSVFGSVPFDSVASVRPDLGDHVHIVWAFSKDFGASGLRCGVLVSENESLHAAVRGLAYWGAVSGHTQWILGQMISDDAWVDRYCSALRHRLGVAYETISVALADAGIPTVPADAGIFLVCDFRRFMESDSWDAEERLWRRILEDANVNITPGAACRMPVPGFMRLCYAAEPMEAVLEGITRVRRLLG